MAIDASLMRVLELKEEDIGAGTLEVGEGGGEGLWAEQEMILLDGEEGEGAAGENILLGDLAEQSNNDGGVEEAVGGDEEGVRDESSICHQTLEDADASISEKSVEESVAIIDQQRGKIIQGNLGSSVQGLAKCTMYV